MPEILEHALARVSVSLQSDKRREILVTPHEPGLYIPRDRCVTSYDLELISHILEVKGPAFLCDEILREEDPKYLKQELNLNVFSFKSPETFVGKRVLDFGCGSGASTLVLSRLMPGAELVGVDLEEKHIDIAKHRVRFYAADNIQLHVASKPARLAAELGQFDSIIMSAVYEHLLPEERRTLFPDLWNALRPGGILFINQTPNRFFPYEGHTSSLPLINFLPDTLAGAAARRLSSRNLEQCDWQTLLRKGIRGGSERELNALFKPLQGKPLYLEPSGEGIKDRIDLWFQHSSAKRMAFLKRCMYWTLKGTKTFTGVTATPNLTLAICKT